MLPRLPLDDRTYAEIVQQTRKLIPKRVPEWTDENAHDPGITFIELFAWLTEMQRYYIGRVPDKNRLRFLDLLGVRPADAASARVAVRFSNISKRLTLPRGTKLMAEDQMFETERSILLAPLSLDRIVTRTEREANDVTATNEHANVVFYAFGKEAAAASKLYISFDRELLPDELITLTVRLQPAEAAEQSGEPPELDQASRDAISPSARLSWKAYCWDEKSQTEGWTPVELLEDETLHLTIGGNVTFRLAAPMRPLIVHPASERARYWICCTVEEPGYELPPRIRQLMLHTVPAVQRDTLCEAIEFTAEGMPDESLEIDSYLGVFGKLRVQVREQDGSWRYWREVDTLAGIPETEAPQGLYTVSRQDTLDKVTITFGNGTRSAVPPPGSSVRVISYVPEFESYAMIGRSNGLPGQSFELYQLPCKRRNALKLQVGVRGSGGEWVWEDWERVDDFDRSTAEDRHFTYDPELRKLHFGNGEHGALPASGSEPNIRLIGCELGGGERGNIKPFLLSEWVNEAQEELGLHADNPGFASGGMEAETLPETLGRAQRELAQAFRAVTNEDYEAIARQTPGAAVARVHTIPLFRPGLSDYPREKAEGQISVVVVPYSMSATPSPSAGFLQTVKRHLDSRRLVTTEIHVIPPVYVKVTVNAVVIVEPQFVDEGAKLAELLERLLRPLDGEHGAKGWTFGRTVYKGDIYSALSGGNGVVYVQDLWLDGEGTHVRKSAGGDILLPPHGLVYSGVHDIKLVSRTHL